jgi:hypothetical protein
MHLVSYEGESIVCRKVVGFFGGFIVWWTIGLLGFTALRYGWSDYAAVEPSWGFTLPMQLARLLLAVVCSIAAGFVAAKIVGQRSAVPWIIGSVILLMMLPSHYQLYDRFPWWYHAFFLLTLVPIVGFSGRCSAR